MQQVSINPVASQTFTVVLNGQSCAFNIYQENPIPDEYGVAAGLYLDLQLNGTDVLTGVRCLDRTRLLLDRTYLGFVGDLIFIDTQGSGPPTFTGAPPYYTGLGSRFLLIYLEESDLADL